jgi:hypothetical protein
MYEGKKREKDKTEDPYYSHAPGPGRNPGRDEIELYGGAARIWASLYDLRQGDGHHFECNMSRATFQLGDSTLFTAIDILIPHAYYGS